MEINENAYMLGSKRSVIREIFEYGKKRAAEVGAENVFDFSIGNPSVQPPKEVSETIQELLKTEDSVSLHGYTSAQGDFGTRKAVSDSVNKRFGLSLTPDNIYMTCGAASSLTISLKAVLNPDEECVVFAPFFTEYRVFIENAGGKVVVSLPNEKDFQIDINDFKAKINENTRVVIINSPNNPSGVVYTANTVKRVCEILKEKEKEYGKTIYLIADEPYRELVYDGVKVPYLMNYYDDTLVCYSYSKSLSLPGERIGYIAVNPAMKDAQKVYLAICGAGRTLGYICAPSLFQQVIKRCVDTKVNVTAYKKNRDILYNALTEYGYECVKPDGAFYLFVKALEKDAVKFCEKARGKDILVVPCDDFGVEGYMRIAYCVPTEKIERSLPRFKELWEQYSLA
ncbi:MAG: pyridoxal phosphate-dependent aminotransferase [Clostridiales bacterium]|nr:pyridoxal phosphate-dependent aminotransferase [Clostridiales bacterium]